MREIMLLITGLYSVICCAGTAQAQSLSRQFLAQFSQVMQQRQSDITSSIRLTETQLPDVASPNVAQAMAGSANFAPIEPESILPRPSRAGIIVPKLDDSGAWEVPEPLPPVTSSLPVTIRLGPGTGAMVGVDIEN